MEPRKLANVVRSVGGDGFDPAEAAMLNGDESAAVVHALETAAFGPDSSENEGERRCGAR